MYEKGSRRRKEEEMKKKKRRRKGKDMTSVTQGFRIVVFPMKRMHRVTFKAYLISNDSTSKYTS